MTESQPQGANGDLGHPKQQPGSPKSVPDSEGFFLDECGLDVGRAQPGQEKKHRSKSLQKCFLGLIDSV